MTAPQSVLRRFSIPFHPRTGELFVYGGFAAGAFTLLMSFTTGNPFFLLVAVASLFGAYYFYPLIDTRSPQIGADTRGLYVRNLGYIPWFMVKSFHIQRIAVRSVEKASMKIHLNDRWKSFLQRDTSIPTTHKLMYRIWKTKGDDMLDINLQHLKDNSRKIESAFMEIWENRPDAVVAPPEEDTKGANE